MINKKRNQLIHYRTNRLLSRLDMGNRLSRTTGVGSDYYRNALFDANPDPNKIDINTSLKDPFESLYIKTYRERNHLELVLFLDTSSSMFCRDKCKLMTEFYSVLKQSVDYYGDILKTFLVSDEVDLVGNRSELDSLFSVRNDLSRKSSGMYELQSLSIHRDALIFIISDFYWDKNLSDYVFSHLTQNKVVPIMIDDKDEYFGLPRWRLAQMIDAESNKKKLVFLTPYQIELIRNKYIEQRKQITSMTQKYGYRALNMGNVLDLKKVNRYFNDI